MKNKLIQGTIILTVAGIVTRILGFFYKIYLSNVLGAEYLGLYQLIFPIYGICFTIYASGLQTAISQLTAGKKYRRRAILYTGIVFSLTFALILSYFIYTNSDWIALNYLHDNRCAPLIKIISYIFPFCGITACINGYCLGKQKPSIPAVTQCLEQLTRILFVWIIASLFQITSPYTLCLVAVYGIIAGELISNIYNVAALFFTHNKRIKENIKTFQIHKLATHLLRLAIPISGTRLVTALLHSLEAVLIPIMLMKYGFSNKLALSYYGVMSGMVMPFIMFPSTITSSLSSILLPTIASENSNGTQKKIKTTTESSLSCSLLIGICSSAVFFTLGDNLGTLIFQNDLAGKYLMVLSILCPFMYSSITLGGVLNGLGKTHVTFINTVSGLAIRILFLIFITPKVGFFGYLVGILVSGLFTTFMDLISVHKRIPFQVDLYRFVIIPFLSLAITSFACFYIFEHWLNLPVSLLSISLKMGLLLVTFLFVIKQSELFKKRF